MCGQKQSVKKVISVFTAMHNSNYNLASVLNQAPCTIIIDNIVSGLDIRFLFLTILIKHYITEYYISKSVSA